MYFNVYLGPIALCCISFFHSMCFTLVAHAGSYRYSAERAWHKERAHIE